MYIIITSRTIKSERKECLIIVNLRSLKIKIILIQLLFMNNLSQFLFLLVEINQETVLNWLGIEDPRIADLRNLEFEYLPETEIDTSILGSSPQISIETFRIILNAVWDRLQHGGLGLADIENIILFMAFFRFIILVLRFNLKTGFLITCIGLVAAYIWYLHLSSIIFGYMRVLFKMPFMTRIALDLIDLRDVKKAARGESFSIRYPIKLLWKSFTDWSSQNNGFNIDPLSMLFTKFSGGIKPYTDRLYYLIYRDVGPATLKMCRTIYRDIAPLARYTFIVRIGKKYCPYLVRWHWTFTMLLSVTERFVIYFVYRLTLYISRVLTPEYRMLETGDSFQQFRALQLETDIKMLYIVACTVVMSHIAFIVYGLLQALWGQYFYVPFFTENVELHLGEVPRTPYSGGNTPGRNAKEDRQKYGGPIRNILYNLQYFIKSIIKKLSRTIKKLFKR
uniref:Uncharacterized protein n=1 Tax=Psammoneis obaidii TaxID=1706219 RepID=A0A2U9NSA3_9STRA|nr:hypothetical protein ycf90 [Psammoneis obaidii]AWT39756.1 hypothetical protein ycf90 [Psammoneis obaidii]